MNKDYVDYKKVIIVKKIDIQSWHKVAGLGPVRCCSPGGIQLA